VKDRKEQVASIYLAQVVKRCRSVEFFLAIDFIVMCKEKEKSHVMQGENKEGETADSFPTLRTSVKQG